MHPLSCTVRTKQKCKILNNSSLNCLLFLPSCKIISVNPQTHNNLLDTFSMGYNYP
jgi:hypothetical protein